MKPKEDKCHLLLSTKKNLTANASNFQITNSNKETSRCNHWQSFNNNSTWKSTEYSVLFQYLVKVAVFLKGFPTVMTVPFLLF